MIEQLKLAHLLDNPPARRIWLLVEAVHSTPFDRAIELARSAEAFITGAAVEITTDDPAGVLRRDQEPSEPIGQPDLTAHPADREAARTGFGLAEDQRDRLVERLAEGARNAELAVQFGISPKQVQGFRMGCAREIAERRTRLADKSLELKDRHQQATATASIDDIVRYLRQQDDVVVQEQSGGYLVNGRFRMSLGELIARANRMRTRQGKPSFGISVSPEPNSPNGHPLFWKETPPTSERVPNGFHQPD